jgi:phospholipid/cholesterol/gamma-HCH transport system substrate-binding protein
MKFSIRFADQIVGALVIMALAILVVVVFMLGKTQRWFVSDAQYVTYFTSASGISTNMAVKYKGFTIGHVKRLSLSDDDRVEILFTIFEEYTHRVTEGSLVGVQESPIGLGSSFNFYPGKGKEPIPPGGVIPEVTSPEAQIYITRGIADSPKSSDSIGNIVNQVSETLENVNQILASVNQSLTGEDGESSLGPIIQNIERTTEDITIVTGTLSEQIEPLILSVNALTDKISDPNGAIMGILDGKGPLYEGINSIAGIIENLNKTSEFLPAQLPQVAVAISELNTILRQVQDLLVAIANNPLLKGGIPEHNETGPTGANPRDHDF